MLRHTLLTCLLLGLCAAGWSTARAAEKTVFVKVQVDSEHAGYEGYRALDGDAATMWHTEFGGANPPGPHQITLDLGAVCEISGFRYLPRQGGGNGTIGRYECYISENAKDLGSPVAAGEFAQEAAENVIDFPAKVKGRYFRLRAISEVAGRPWTSIAELRPLVEGVAFRAKDAGPIALVHEDGTPMSETEIQYVSLLRDLRNRGQFAKAAAETHNPQALIFDSDRDPARHRAAADRGAVGRHQDDAGRTRSGRPGKPTRQSPEVRRRDQPGRRRRARGSL